MEEEEYDLPFRLTFLGEKKGRGLIAEKDLNKGQVIWVEEPLVCCQYQENKVPRSMEGTDEQDGRDPRM